MLHFVVDSSRGLRVVMLYRVPVGYQRFGEPCCLHLLFTLKIQAARFSETLVSYRKTLRCHKTEDLDLNFHHR